VIFLMVMMELSQLRLAIEFGEDDDGDEEILDDERDDRKSVGAQNSPVLQIFNGSARLSQPDLITSRNIKTGEHD